MRRKVSLSHSPTNGGTEGKQLVKNHAQPVDIGLNADFGRSASGLFRRHLPRRSHERTVTRELFVAIDVPGETKIR